VKYAAFISYNHRDRRTASWLHRAIENYRVPKALWGREGALGAIGSRLPPLFQDREELAASSDLAASVREALEQSSSLIVVCTPHGAKSRWVNEEVRAFTAMGRRDRIQCVIAGGEPNASRREDLDSDLECLPPALFEGGGGEPLGADIRPGQDGRELAKLKLIAGVLGVGFDELRQREAARRQRRMMIATTASVAGFAAMTALAATAIVSRNEAVRQRDLAREKTLTAQRTVEFVKSIFAVADPSESRGATITAREILNRGAAHIDQGLEREPTVKAELGTTLGEVYTNLGLLHDGAGLISRMLSVRGVAPSTRARQYLALGDTRELAADDEAAIKAYEQALALAAAPGADREDLVPRILSGLGEARANSGDPARGERDARQALAADRRAKPASVDVARDLEALATTQILANKLAAAPALLQEALALRTRLQGTDHPLVLQDLNRLGYVAYMRHDSAQAGRLWRQELTSEERLLGPDHPVVATALNNVALTEVEQRQYAQALPLLNRAIHINLTQRSDTVADVVFMYTNLGIALRATGDPAGAVAALRKAIVAGRLHKHRGLAPAMAMLSDLQCARGDVKAGLAGLDEATPIMAHDYPGDPWRRAWIDTIRGGCLLKTGQKATAARLLAEAGPAIRERWPPGSHYLARYAELAAAAR